MLTNDEIVSVLRNMFDPEGLVFFKLVVNYNFLLCSQFKSRLCHHQSPPIYCRVMNRLCAKLVNYYYFNTVRVKLKPL